MDQVCPRCKTTKYRNPNMKLMVNVCGHNICETCVELLFAKVRRLNIYFFFLFCFHPVAHFREVDPVLSATYR